MHTLADFYREFIVSDSTRTDLQKTLLWRTHWADEPIDWEYIKVSSISGHDWGILVNLVGECAGTIRMESPIKVFFKAPVDRATELGQFSCGQYVRVTGILDKELQKMSQYECHLRGDATLSPGNPPPPPLPVQLDPPAKNSSNSATSVLLWVCIAIAAYLSYLFFTKVLY